VLAQIGPRLQRRGEAFGHCGDVEQDGFTALPNGEPAKPGRVHPR
jgi:hypothetical protein